MTISLSNWLALRRPADIAARSTALTKVVVDLLPRAQPLRILDLATGTGSNLRYLAPRLPSPQEWLVVDRDAILLAEVPGEMTVNGRNVRIETRCQNLAVLKADMFAGRHLVTASALLDLVSEAWLRVLADRCRAAGAMALFALSYNGESRCSPDEPEDDVIREMLNRHQKTDKGFGPAAGPEAAEGAARAFVGVGYQVRREESNWELPPRESDLQRHLIEGWAGAALEVAPEQSAMIRDWLDRRLAHVAARRSHIVVCHEDVAAWPPASGRAT
jgi:hypothetical protein